MLPTIVMEIFRFPKIKFRTIIEDDLSPLVDQRQSRPTSADAVTVTRITHVVYLVGLSLPVGIKLNQIQRVHRVVQPDFTWKQSIRFQQFGGNLDSFPRNPC